MVERDVYQELIKMINEQDVVTRVPPGYVHFGKLIWFREGKLVLGRQSSTRGLEPLSTAEFESLQKSLRDLRQLGKSFDPTSLRSYGEQVAAITDHFMDAYLGGIDRLAK